MRAVANVSVLKGFKQFRVCSLKFVKEYAEVVSLGIFTLLGVNETAQNVPSFGKTYYIVHAITCAVPILTC